MNNKKISCVAKNNEINAPKTRTVTVQMNCKWNPAAITITTIRILILLLINIIIINIKKIFFFSAADLCEDLAKAKLPH